MYNELVDLSEAVPYSPPELRGWWCIQLKEGQEHEYEAIFNGKVMTGQDGKPVMQSHTTHPKCLYDEGAAGSLLMFPSRKACQAAIESYKKGEYSEHARIMDGMNPVAPPRDLPANVKPTAKRKAS
jgi:hypothetical protein